MKLRNLPFLPWLLLLCSPLLVSSTALADLSQLPDKATTDKSEYRRLELENGLKVILLSDPDLNKSSASLVVGVGSYGDPKERQGLAHFLEHMLFLGTEKYPDEAEYSNYLRSNGGYSNAYTSGDHTNYHFEISHQAFEGALDRFSQFFIAPLFSAEFTEREMNAVDSEFEKNLQNDGWRQQQIFRTMVREDHPENHFSIGNHDTLKGIQRDEFIDFYNRYYSANNMALAILSNSSLDQIERWAKQYFSAIRNNRKPAIDYDDQLINPKRQPGLVKMEPVKDRRALQMAFPTFGTRALYRSKPDDLIGYLLGYEGKGSLLSYLKQLGLATSMSGGAYRATKDYSLFYIEAELTPAGTERWQEVMQATFAFVRKLRHSDYPVYLFEERATMARLDELYKNKGEGAPRALKLGRDAIHYPLKDVERIDYLWQEPAPASYFQLLDFIKPENMIATLEAKGVPTDSTEKYFGIRYSVMPFSKELLESLHNPPEVAELTLPAANPFIPTSVMLLAERPVMIADQPGLTLFYAQDTTFERPQVGYRIRLVTSKAMAELRPMVLRDFYLLAIREMLNEQIYTAGVAGLKAGIANSPEGLVLDISGYNQSANGFLQYMTSNMREIQLDSARFEAIKERQVRELENAKYKDAWAQAREIERKMFYQHYHTPSEKLKVAREISLADVKAFSKELFSQGHIQMVAYGNVTQGQAVDAAKKASANLQLAPLAADQLLTTKTIRINEGDKLIAANNLEVNNSAYRHSYLLGDSTPKTRAVASMLGNFFAEPYYSEMRTRQQLGYIVAGFMTEIEDELYARFIIQSADYTAAELQDRSEAFLATLPKILKELPDAKLEAIKDGVRAELEKKDKSIVERTRRYFKLAFENDMEWDYAPATVKALEKVTREDLLAMLDKIASGTGANFAVLSLASQHTGALQDIEQSFDDISQWKTSQTYN